LERKKIEKCVFFSIFSNLPNKCDPYVKITVGNTQIKTCTKNNVSNEAEYNQKMSLNLDGSEDYLEIAVWDYDRWSKDDLVATTGKVSLKEVVNNWINDNKPVWINMTNEPPTKIYLKLDFVKQ
jgi:Ca2+-dependent lipid-binding protein